MSLVLLASFAACGGGSDSDDCQSCDTDEDCPEGWVCSVFRMTEGYFEGELFQYCAPEGDEDYECGVLVPASANGLDVGGYIAVPCLSEYAGLERVGSTLIDEHRVGVYDYPSATR